MQDVVVETLDFNENQIFFFFGETMFMNYNTISSIKPLLKTETDFNRLRGFMDNISRRRGLNVYSCPVLYAGQGNCPGVGTGQENCSELHAGRELFTGHENC